MSGRALVPIVLLFVIPLAGSAARGGAATTSASTCDNGGPVDQAIHQAFDDTGQVDHAFAIVHRESGCDPCAFAPGGSDCSAWNPSGAKGLFQLDGHDDLIHGACPFLYPLPWQVPDCNAIAARWLYDDAGFTPWGG